MKSVQRAIASHNNSKTSFHQSPGNSPRVIYTEEIPEPLQGSKISSIQIKGQGRMQTKN